VDGQLNLGQLRYQGSIRSYLTEFRALNIFARATGEALREKVDLAMTSEILKMCFKHYLEDFADDEGYLQATYQAGLQVERLIALEKASEPGRPHKTEDKKKDVQNQSGSDNDRKSKKTNEPAGNRLDQLDRTKTWWGGRKHGATKDDALKGVPSKEQEEYGQNREDCWRCGRNGYKTYECFSFSTRKGNVVPRAPWKTAAVTEGKRKRSEGPETQSAAKQQKVATVDAMETDTAHLTVWADNDSEMDF